MSGLLKYPKLFSKAFTPMGPVFIAYILWMPTTGSPGLAELALHQQIIALLSLPAMAWSTWRFHKLVYEEKATPEQRVLGGDE